MKYELGPCLLNERMAEAGITIDQLAQSLMIRPERLTDFIGNKRVMSLKMAVAIADTVGCDVESLYKWIPCERKGSL